MEALIRASLLGKMRARCLEAFAKIPGLEIVVPSEELTQDGCVGTVEEGMKAADLFNKENVQGLIIGNMNFGFETAIGAMLSKIRKDMPVLHFATRSGPFSPAGQSRQRYLVRPVYDLFRAQAPRLQI